MVQRMSRNDRLFGRDPADIPNWMAIRNADNKRRNDNQAKLRAARLARDASQTPEPAASPSVPSRGTRRSKRKTKP